MSKGAGCDCEIFMNGWSLRREYQVYNLEAEEYDYPEEVPAAKAVSTSCKYQPCRLWTVWNRRWW